MRSRLLLEEYAVSCYEDSLFPLFHLTSLGFQRKRFRRGLSLSKEKKALETFENELSNLKRFSHHQLVKLIGCVSLTQVFCVC